jgi:hypothetical protein
MARRRVRRMAAGLAALLLGLGGGASIWAGRSGTNPLTAVAVLATRLSVAKDASLAAGPFVVLYPPGQAAAARMVLDELTRDLPVESRSLGAHLSGDLYVILYPSMAALDQTAGLSPAEADIGLYDAGTIRLAAPTSWIRVRPWQPVFAREGPVAHELAHALLDAAAHGNYPAWFNEGVAQYEDWRLTGFQWLTPTNRLDGPLYSMAALTADFYRLPDQSRAYREALALVQYLVRRKGAGGLRRMIFALGHGASFDEALEQTYGLSPDGLYLAWRRSLATRDGAGAG